MITIRRGRPGDLAEVQRLNQALFQYEHDQRFHSRPDSFNLNWPYGEAGTKYFTSCLSDDPNSAVFIAESEHKPIGYLAATFAIKLFRSQNPVGEIDNMFVEADFRSRGAGSKLVDAFMGWARENNVAIIRVDTHASNSQAQKFYRDHGFSDSELYLEQSLSEEK